MALQRAHDKWRLLSLWNPQRYEILSFLCTCVSCLGLFNFYNFFCLGVSWFHVSFHVIHCDPRILKLCDVVNNLILECSFWCSKCCELNLQGSNVLGRFYRVASWTSNCRFPINFIRSCWHPASLSACQCSTHGVRHSETSEQDEIKVPTVALDEVRGGESLAGLSITRWQAQQHLNPRFLRQNSNWQIEYKIDATQCLLHIAETHATSCYVPSLALTSDFPQKKLQHAFPGSDLDNLSEAAVSVAGAWKGLGFGATLREARSVWIFSSTLCGAGAKKPLLSDCGDVGWTGSGATSCSAWRSWRSWRSRFNSLSSSCRPDSCCWSCSWASRLKFSAHPSHPQGENMP